MLANRVSERVLHYSGQAPQQDRQQQPMSISDWYKTLAGERIDDFVLDEYVGCGKIGAVYRSHQHDIRPDPDSS